MTVVHFQVKLWTVFHDQVVDFDVLTVYDIYQMWTIILVVDVLLIIHKQYHPPMVSSTVDFTATTNFYCSAVVDLNEIPVAFGVGLTRPEFDVFRSSYSPQNL